MGHNNEEDEWMQIWIAITGVALAWVVVGCFVMLLTLIEGP